MESSSGNTTEQSSAPGAGTGPAARSFSGALRQLASSQKSSKGAPAYSRYINRRLGRILAAAAYVLRLTPNGVTALSATATFAGIALIALAPPTVGIAVLITVLLILGYALDSADGQLARLTGGGSLVGEWLDHVVDALKLATLHLAVAISWYRFFDLDAAWLLVPLGYSAVSAVFFFAMTLTDQMRRLSRGTTAMILKHDGTTSFLYSMFVVPADYGLLCLVFLLMWWAPVFVGAYSLLFLANFLVLLVCLWRWYRAVKALQTAAK